MREDTEVGIVLLMPVIDLRGGSDESTGLGYYLTGNRCQLQAAKTL